MRKLKLTDTNTYLLMNEKGDFTMKKEEAELAKITSEQTEADDKLIRDVIGDV